MSRAGIAVYCLECGRQKSPIGRSIPLGMDMCTDECSGYRNHPKPGSLWPRELERDFGYPVGPDATEDEDDGIA